MTTTTMTYEGVTIEWGFLADNLFDEDMESADYRRRAIEAYAAAVNAQLRREYPGATVEASWQDGLGVEPQTLRPFVRQRGTAISERDVEMTIQEVFDRGDWWPDETTECVYCYADLDAGPEQAPALDDDDSWEDLAAHHASTCEWILTRAHRR